MPGKKIEEPIIAAIKKALREIIPSASAELPSIFSSILLEIPKNKLHGDLSCSIAMQLGGFIPNTPEEIASMIVGKLSNRLKDTIEKIEIIPPGFINFFFSRDVLYEILIKIRKEKANYGRNNIGGGKKIQIEFVSANPTGPLSVAHGRQAAVGDALANILMFSGYRVFREYYLNDEGNQITLLGESIKARALNIIGRYAELPEGGYRGEYAVDIAEAFLSKYGKKNLDRFSIDLFSRFGCRYILKGIKNDLREFGVKFDLFFSQRSLSKSGKVEKALKFLRKKGLIYEKEGALWFATSKFGDDKDRVVVRSNGEYTYFTPDIAYHQNKLKRGFKKIINIWGPDHHGYISRIKAALKVLGCKDDAASIIIVQLVTLLKGKEKIQMSTRSGKFLTLREVVKEVGKDVARFFYITRRANSHLDFDLELAKKASLDNPVYYIQYAHARICSILKLKKGVARAGHTPPDFKLLDQPDEITILKFLRQFPDIIVLSSEILEPHRLVNYLQELASAFHAFYTKHRVISDDLELTSARVALIEATKMVLDNGLRLLGVCAPEKM